MRLNVKTKNAAALSLFNKNIYKSLVTHDYFERKTYLLRPKSWVILQERHGYCYLKTIFNQLFTEDFRSTYFMSFKFN